MTNNYNTRITTSEVFSDGEGEQEWVGHVSTTFKAKFKTRTEADRFVKRVGSDLNRIGDHHNIGEPTAAPTITDAFSFNSSSQTGVDGWSNGKR